MLAQTTRELDTSHRGTLRSSMRESGRQLSSPTIPSKAGRATSRAETLRQKMESVLVGSYFMFSYLYRDAL